MGSLGAQAVVAVADDVGVGVHFNPFVRLDGQLVKYGVLRTADLLDDLHSWRRLYVAGRLHKPVATLVTSEAVEQAVARNRWLAALTALLLLPPHFSTLDLLRTIVALSYKGDVRLGWAEDPHKVDRIVAGSQQELQQIYLPHLLPRPPSPAAPSPLQPPHPQVVAEAPVPGALARQGAAVATDRLDGSTPSLASLARLQPQGEDTWRREVDDEVAVPLMAHLPPAVLAKVAARVGFAVPELHCEAGSSTALELAHAAHKTGHHRQLLSAALKETVRSSSQWQAASGALAAGPGKAWTYVSAKLSKVLKASTAPGAAPKPGPT